VCILFLEHIYYTTLFKKCNTFFEKIFRVKKKVKVVGYAPTLHKFCPLTHFGDLLVWGTAPRQKRLFLQSDTFFEKSFLISLVSPTNLFLY